MIRKVARIRLRQDYAGQVRYRVQGTEYSGQALQLGSTLSTMLETGLLTTGRSLRV